MGIFERPLFCLSHMVFNWWRKYIKRKLKVGWQESEWIPPSQSKTALCMRAQLCLTLCEPMDCSLWVFSVHGILQARMLQWVAVSSSRGSYQSRNRIHISCVGRKILYHWATWGALGVSAEKGWKPLMGKQWSLSRAKCPRADVHSLMCMCPGDLVEAQILLQ